MRIVIALLVMGVAALPAIAIEPVAPAKEKP